MARKYQPVLRNAGTGLLSSCLPLEFAEGVVLVDMKLAAGHIEPSLLHGSENLVGGWVGCQEAD